MKHMASKATVAFITVTGLTAGYAQEPTTPVKGFRSIGTILVKGDNAQVEGDTARFTVRMSAGMMTSYPTSSALAVVFDDALLNKDEVQCPIINIKGRQRKLVEIEPDVIQVDAQVTEQEKERVLKARCVVVTPTPAISEFKFLPRAPNNDYSN